MPRARFLALVITFLGVSGFSLPVSAHPGEPILELAWPFLETEQGDQGWHLTEGSNFHVGFDHHAEDWNFRGGNSDLGKVALSATSGEVIRNADVGGCYGKQVVVRSSINGRTIYLRYAHLDTIAVPLGPVSQGTNIGTVGRSGSGGEGCGFWTAHLHLSVYARFPPAAESDGLPFDFTIETVRLLDGSVSPAHALRGGTLAFVYRIENVGQPLGVRLGASIRKTGTVAWIDDIGRDKIVDVPSGVSENSRSFVLPPNLEPGIYDVAWTLLREADKSWLARREDASILTVEAGRISSLDIVGGTWLDRDDGLIGTAFAWNPIAEGQTIPLATVAGPLSWNSGSLFTFGRYQPEGIAPSRALSWDLIPPVTGEYVARAQLGEESLERQFMIDRQSQLAPPEIMDFSAVDGTVFVSWTAAQGSNSFLVRVNPAPFAGVISRELLIGRNIRSLALTEVPLVAGQTYQLVVWAFGSDLVTPQALTSPFNIASDSTIFVYPAE